MLFASLAFAGVLTVGPAATTMAQTQSTPPRDTTSASAQASQTMNDVSKWTRKQWHAVKVKWQEERASWNSCQSEARAQSLSGRKSWQFLYDCMTRT
jgi:hypothetical protein